MPKKLSPYGQEIRTRIAIDWWLENATKAVREKLKGKQRYDIEKFCTWYVTDDSVGEALRRDLKEVAFEQCYSLSDIYWVMGMELRDKVLSLNEYEKQ